MSNKPCIRTVFFLIISFSFWGLRLSYIDDQKDAWDQNRDFVRTLQHVEGTSVQYAGPRFGHVIRIPSVVYHWLLSVPLFFSKTMVAMRVYVVFFNYLAMLLLFLVGLKMFDVQVARISALLYTFSPFAVKYSVFLWNPNFTPLFAILFFGGVYLYTKDDRSKSIFLLVVVGYFALSFHIIAIAYGLLFLTVWYLFKMKINLTYFFLGLGVVTGLTLIYIYFDWRHGFSNLNSEIFAPNKKTIALSH